MKEKIIYIAKRFLYRDGEFSPIKFFISVFLFLTVWVIIDKIIFPNRLGTDFFAVLWGSVAVLLGADVWRSNTKEKNIECIKENNTWSK